MQFTKIEDYSSELIFAAKTCHQLHVTIFFLENGLEFAWDLTPDIGNDIHLFGQIDLLKHLQNEAGEHFKKLLKQESKLELTFIDNYPFVDKFPDWIYDLFAQRSQDELEQMYKEGGTMINFWEPANVVTEKYMESKTGVPDFETPVFGAINPANHPPTNYVSTCVPSFVPDSFITVWYPIAGDFEEPGYAFRNVSMERQWAAYSREV